MRYIVIEEFPEGNFNIPVLDDGGEPIFDDLDEAMAFSEELHNPYVLPLQNLSSISISNIDKIEYIYDNLCEKFNIDKRLLFSKSRKKEYILIKFSVRYYLYEYRNFTYQYIAQLEKSLFNYNSADHTTIMNSIAKVKDFPKEYRDVISYIRTLDLS